MDLQTVLFAPRFLEQHAGAVIRDPTTALIELVANCWDAGATRVEIDWPARDEERPFRILDNGHGMTAAGFEKRWRTLSYDRSAQQGPSVEFPEDMESPPQRRAFGRNGIGRHGVFCFGEECELTSWRGGVAETFHVRKGQTVPLEIAHLGSEERVGHGTEIRVTEPRYPRMTADQARTEIGVRFLTDPSFEILIDGSRVAISDVPDRQLDEDRLSIAGVGIITIRLLDTRTTDKTAKQHGVAWHVHGRLVGECSWRGTGHERFLDGRRAEAKRYTFLVKADSLADAVLPDWSGFDANDPRFIEANSVVQDRIADWLIELTKEKRAETTRAVRHAHRSTLKRMGPLGREKWEEFVNDAQGLCPSISERDLSLLAGLLAKLEVSKSEYQLIDRLQRLDPGHLDDLYQILTEWSVDTAKIVLDELKVRLKLLHELQEKILDPRADEVQELQPLFRRGLWIFGPEFETIEFTSNQGMTRVVQDIFGSSGTGSRNRPDFVVLADGTAGLYSYPLYDEEGGEIGTDRLVIVELKRPNVTIGTKEKAQPWKYVKELWERGHVTNKTKMTCFVLGSHVDPAEAAEATHLNGSVRVRPLTYDTVIQRAESRLLRLYERVKEAPFLQNLDLSDFLSDAELGDPDLFENLR